MKKTHLDDILAKEDELAPSSGFMAAVMERVEDEAGMPAPIPFPWKRAMPGMALAAGVLGWGAVELARCGVPALRGVSLPPVHLPAAAFGPLIMVAWVAGALAASAASWLMATRLAGRSGLL